MKYLFPILPIVFSLALLGQGCAPTTNQQTPDGMMNTEQPMMQDDHMDTSDEVMNSDMMEDEDTMMDDTHEDSMMNDEGSMMNDETSVQNQHSTYVPYTKAAYQDARAAHKPILLYFYANWCPTCAEQEPRNQALFQKHEGGVAAFRVNYNDTDTDDDERALAKEFGVVYQHTMFFIDRDGNVQKKTVGTVSDANMLTNLASISK